ncbi:hypothetical protein KIN_07970 [Litoreibacter roseus]|uniref:Uncharacterized protein n=1 Tax=Litoreibacter roseus TaxID=2601869 RepID=A0A6N6JBR7_9RHOB|nr:hypothetical protein KIN_07970 [Litoreibacter roseus]
MFCHSLTRYGAGYWSNTWFSTLSFNGFCAAAEVDLKACIDNILQVRKLDEEITWSSQCF